MIATMFNYLGIPFGLISVLFFPKENRYRIWVPLYVFNCVINIIFDKSLVKTGKVTYPRRFLPNMFTINIIYDVLVCPFISIWFCMSSYRSNLSGLIGKLFLFGLPQAVYEIVLERKSKALKFKDNWRWFYSLYLVFIVKIISRSVLHLLKKANNRG